MHEVGPALLGVLGVCLAGLLGLRPDMQTLLLARAAQSAA